jgi:hypothetical protein
MYTAMLSVQNIMGAAHDVWSVNVEEEYHEEMARGAPPGAGAGPGQDRSGQDRSGQDRSGRAAPVLPKRPAPPQRVVPEAR